MKFNFTPVSGNAKTGPIPVTITSKDSCPPSCPLYKNGCYASAGRLNIHWSRLENKGLDLAGLIEAIKSIPNGRLWRHNQAGDLPGDGETIDTKALGSIVKANAGKRGFTYTHKNPFVKKNASAILDANKKGFTINLSANGLNHADDLADLGIAPVVSILPENQSENTTTPKGRKVVVCPNYTHNVQCMDCGLCQRSDRSVIVGFPAHGISKKKTETVFTKN
jgi:hypothetical protein